MKIALPPWPQFSEKAIHDVEAVLRSGKVNYWTGKRGMEFEKRFAEWQGSKYAVSVATGTAALHVALAALGIGPGDEVIVPSYTKEAVMRGAMSTITLVALLLARFTTGQGSQEAPSEGKLRSFAAIRVFDLAPPLPGTEKVNSKLAELLRRTNERHRRKVESYKALGLHRNWGPTDAKCRVRVDLPKPRNLGLECSDADGSYVGTLRARSERELRDRLMDLCFGLWEPGGHDAVAVPGTLPLHEYGSVHVSSTGPVAYGSPQPKIEYVEYVAELLREDGFWRVVKPTDPVPPEEGVSVMECRLAASSNGVMGSPSGAFAHLYMTDDRQRPVREVGGRSDWANIKGALRAAVRHLVEARRLDEEIHKRLEDRAVSVQESWR